MEIFKKIEEFLRQKPFSIKIIEFEVDKMTFDEIQKEAECAKIFYNHAYTPKLREEFVMTFNFEGIYIKINKQI